MFHQISKHLDVRQKYSAERRIFNSLLRVWKSVETLSFVFDIFDIEFVFGIKLIFVSFGSFKNRDSIVS